MDGANDAPRPFDPHERTVSVICLLPRRFLRLVVARAGVVALAVAISAPAPAAGRSSAPALTVEPFDLTTKTGENVAAELGRFSVPAHHDRPHGEQLELSFVRLPSTAAVPGAPIVYLAGGPGGSGIATARGSRLPVFQRLRAVADVIALDQRGTGRSSAPPDCPHAWSLPLDRAPTRNDAQQAMNDAARACAAFWRDRGVDLGAFHTNAIADDLEVLRRALGVPKLALWGTSYGSHLALAAVRRHPESIERIALHGIEGPDHTLKLPSNLDAALVAAEAALADRWPPELPPLRTTLATALERLEETPGRATVRIPQTGEQVEIVVGAFDLRWGVSQLLRGPETFGLLAKIATELAAGDVSGLAEASLRYQRRGTLNAMSVATDAASGASPERLRRISIEARTTLLGDVVNLPYPELGAALGVEPLGASFRRPLLASTPALLISGTLDGRTPPTNASEVLVGLDRGVHLVIEGAGHGDGLFLAHPQIGAALEAFFRGDAGADRRLVLPVEDPGS